MLYITEDSKIRDYFVNKEKVSQSNLKNLAKGVEAYKKLIEQRKESSDFDEKEPIIIGNIVDTTLFSVGGTAKTAEKYAAVEIAKKPSDTIVVILKALFEKAKLYGTQNILFKDVPDAFYNSILDSVDWYKNRTHTSRIETIKKDANSEGYYNFLTQYADKICVSEEEYSTANAMIATLQNDSKTKKYFDREKIAANSKIDIYYQLPVYFTYNGIDCKALYDLVVVVKDAAGKQLKIIPIDLKTTSCFLIDFTAQFKRMRYDIQGAFYSEPFNPENNPVFDTKGPIKADKDTKIENFRFIVASSANPEKVLEVKMDDNLLDIGKYGNYSDNGILWDKGFTTLIDDWKYYAEHGMEDEKLLKEANYSLNINWKGMYAD